MANLEKRPPIVTILGHVDHGKTTLLDYIRKTKVQEREAGGITQGIGASTIKTKEGEKITFIDTPGHAAFESMRSRGAKVADIAVLVVAANEGAKPQTIEALKHIKKAEIPFIVAVTKIDLPESNVQAVLGDLEKEEVLFEGRGGDTPFVEVSAKTGEGVENLLEMISLVSEVNEIKGDLKGDLEAVVIETAMEKGGPTVNLVVRNGVLKAGQEVYAGKEMARVRAIYDEMQKQIKEVKPGFAAKVLGFRELPDVGALVTQKPYENKDKKNLGFKGEIEENKLPVIIKASNTGFVEAAVAGLPEFAVVIHSGVGDVTETDILLAKTSNASVFALDVKVSKQIEKAADNEGVEIKKHKIIYELFEELKKIYEEGQTKIIGRAEVLDTFPYNNKIVAGGKVVQGQISSGDKIVIFSSEGEELGEAKVTSLRRGKEEIRVAKQGEEFGVIFDPQLDFDAGSMILSVEK